MRPTAALERLAEEESRAQGEVAGRADRQRRPRDRAAGARPRVPGVAAEPRRGRGREIIDADQERHGLAAMIESGRQSMQGLEREAMQAEGQIAQLKSQEAMLLGLQNASEGVDSAARFLLGDEADGCAAAAGRAHRPGAGYHPRATGPGARHRGGAGGERTGAGVREPAGRPCRAGRAGGAAGRPRRALSRWMPSSHRRR